MAKNASLKGKKIVLTGKFKAWARKDAEALLKQHGALTSSSVSAKTDLLIAGGAAGSKLYDAFRLKIPILAEGHLQLLLDGRPLHEVIALARTFYTLEVVPERPAGSLAVLGGLAPGVAAGRWPTYGGAPMEHLFTLDLAAMPALRAHYPASRALSVFCSDADAVTMYDIASPDNRMMAIVFTTQAQIDEQPAAPAVKSRAPQWFRPVEHGWGELEEHFSRHRVLGAVPFWCQDQQHQGNFIMQCGETFGVSGDGLVYVFDDKIFAQFT